MSEVVSLRSLEVSESINYRIWLKFSDGEDKIIDLRTYLGKGFTAELLDYNKFKEVFIEPGRGIAWPNGYDFCPNFLRGLEGQKRISDLKRQDARTAAQRPF